MNQLSANKAEAHAKQKFDKALQTLPKEKEQDSLVAAGERFCFRLFQLEQVFGPDTEACYINKRHLRLP